jgi:hypothetical protein
VVISSLCLICLGISLLLDAGHEVFSLQLRNSPFLLHRPRPSSSADLSQKLQAHGTDPLTLSSQRFQWKIKTNPKGKMNRIVFFVLLFVLLLKVFEILFTLFALLLSVEQYRRFRSFPLSTFSPIEGIFVILIEKQSRNLSIVILRTLPRFLTLLAFLGFGLLLYTVLGLSVCLSPHMTSVCLLPDLCVCLSLCLSLCVSVCLSCHLTYLDSSPYL